MAERRPTILQIVPRLDAGGVERSTVEVAQAIVEAGGRALVVCEGGRLARDVEAAGAELLALPVASKNPWRMLANARALACLIEREAVGLVHARSRAPAWSGLIAARRRGVPFVTTYHGAYRETNAAKRLYNGVMARGNVVIANSKYTANLIEQRYATERGRIEIIHRGVDPSAFDPSRLDPARVRALRERWGVGPGGRVVLHPARLTGWKGQSVLIDAAARLKRAGMLDEVSIILAGDAQGRDAYVQDLHRQIDSNELQRNVRFAGHVVDMAAAYLVADVTVIASTEPEAFGRTAIEAAAMGCPVIATRIGAPPETVLASPPLRPDEATGWLIAPGNAGALTDALAKVLALAPETRAAMAKRGRQHVLANFTVEAMQRRTLAVYDRLLRTSLEAGFRENRGATLPSPLSSGNLDLSVHLPE